MDLDTDDRRRHARCTVYEPCCVVVKSQEYEGAVVDMSVVGAAIRLDVHLEVQPAVGTPVFLYIERVGRIPAKVARPLIDGIAVEFRIDPDKGKHLGVMLKRVLNDYPLDDG